MKETDVPDFTSEPPAITDLGGKVPEAWNALIEAIGASDPGSPAAREHAARLQVWLLFADMRVRQLEAIAAAKRDEESISQARTMAGATRVLAAAAIVLALDTIALIWATFSA